MASISVHSDLMEQVLPTKGQDGGIVQDFEDHYTGCFLVQLWQYGQWMDVLVDDRQVILLKLPRLPRTEAFTV